MLSLLPFSGKPDKSELTAPKNCKYAPKRAIYAHFGAYLFINEDY